MATIPALAHTQNAFIWRFIIVNPSDYRVVHVVASMPVYQFQRDFTLVVHRETVNQNRAARYIRKIREMMVTGGKK